MNNHSPWLDFDRPSFSSLSGEQNFDVAIIGGGIAGVSTLYFLLKNTDKKVVLLEKGKIASGATGHNAGFAINWLEKVSQDLIAEQGFEKTKNGYREIDSGWDLIDEMSNAVGAGPVNFIEGGGEVFTSLQHFFNSAEEESANESLGRGGWEYLVSKENLNIEIPDSIKKFVKIVPREELLGRFGLKDEGYIAAAIPTGRSTKKTRINSARLCIDLIKYLLEKYANRFSVFENSEITKVEIEDSKNILISDSGKVIADEIVLCTNGYLGPEIIDKKKNKKLTKIKDDIERILGYAGGFLDMDVSAQTSALFDDRGTYKDTPYFYYHHVPGFENKGSLAVLGGPEKTLSKEEVYDENQQIPEGIPSIYRDFLLRAFGKEIKGFDYLWHGLMGYTPSGTRWVGRDPDFPTILYNLGCNGVGFLTSIVGGEKISKIINGENLPPSMFDPS
ncbi:MAG TPA: FAD-binding oxidoreductase [Patescibacteria group bacterium]|nr:FAD-binding oxidoreductase [Patescibacteria group bacterium]